MKIANVDVGLEAEPLVIAEMSGNHNHDLDRALQLVDAAADAGVQALKLQTYTAATLTIDCERSDFLISDSSSLWNGRTLYSLYDEAHTPWEWHATIAERCSQRGLIFFSTPFDSTAVDFLEDLNVPCYKIASFENKDLELLKYVASTGKPMIVSTGMASVADLADMVDAIRNSGCRDLILLKCTSAYPSDASNANVLTIPHMRTLFGCEVGLSDHSPGIGVALAAIAVGATVIEKHLTLRRSDGGVDSSFSMEPEEFRRLVEESKRAHLALGRVEYTVSEAEKGSLVFRRSLYVVRDIEPGEVLTRENVRAIRPGFGLDPKHLPAVLGRRAKERLERGTPLKFESLA